MEAGYVSKLHSNTQILQNPVMFYLFTNDLWINLNLLFLFQKSVVLLKNQINSLNIEMSVI